MLNIRELKKSGDKTQTSQSLCLISRPTSGDLGSETSLPLPNCVPSQALYKDELAFQGFRNRASREGGLRSQILAAKARVGEISSAARWTISFLEEHPPASFTAALVEADSQQFFG
jgi:hypothetical protein